MIGGGISLMPKMSGITRERLAAFLVLAICVSPLVSAHPSGTKATSASVRTAASPEFSPAGGVFSRVQVKLSGPGTIHYTLDGSEPTENGSRYSGPIVISQSTLIKARSFEPGVAASPVVVQAYTIADRRALEFNSNLPLVIVNTFGRPIQKDNKAQVSARIVDVDGSKRSKVSGKADFDGSALLNLRGNTSLRYP